MSRKRAPLLPTAPPATGGAPIHLYVDSADRHEVAQCLPHPLVYGVTTNPSLMKRAGLSWNDLPSFVEHALSMGAKAVQVQVRSKSPEEMIRDAELYSTWGGAEQIIVKIPVTREGLVAAEELSNLGIPVTMTALYAVEQVVWSAMVDARYAAPYLGRMHDRGINGHEVVQQMQRVLDDKVIQPPPRLRLLVASLRSRQQVVEALAMGVAALTVPPSLFHELVERPETRDAEDAFLADAASL